MKKLSEGQTVIEVIIALALITLFLSGVVIVELYAMRNLEYSQNKSTATKLARQQIERARVLRDSGGMYNIGAFCSDAANGCFIDSKLGPTPYSLVTPVGKYTQKIIVKATTQADCPVPTVASPPLPVAYVVKAVVSWGQGAVIPPNSQIEVSSCITDWR